MPDSPLIDEAERDRVRYGLQRYKRLHGIKDTILQQTMVAVLERTDAPYVKIRSLQRFIDGTHHTEDDKVRRYRKFLERVNPPALEDKVGAALADFLLPIGDLSVAAFHGQYRMRYETLALTNPGSAGRPTAMPIGNANHGDSDTIEPSLVTLAESSDPRFLRVTVEHPAPQAGPVISAEAGMFARSGLEQFSLITSSFAGAPRFAVLSVTRTDPLTMQGVMLQTQSVWEKPITDAPQPPLAVEMERLGAAEAGEAKGTDAA